MAYGRYNPKSRKSQQQAIIDANKEMARREWLRRQALSQQQEVAPTFRGAALELQSIAGNHFEVIIAGAAETGKTFAACYLIDQVLRNNPNVQAVLARKIRATIVPTVLRTYLRIIAGRSDVVSYGGKEPEWFDYTNGSRLWITGLDKPGNALSSERDIIYVNQAEELSLGDWETLTTRATGRAGNLPWSLMLGDCNPAGKNHWIISRKSIHLLRSKHQDNPSLFNEDGTPTAQGEKSLAILSNLSEPRRSRLFLGLWSSASGVVYETFDAVKHVIPRFDIPILWPRIRVIDFGYRDPFVCLWIAINPVTRRMYGYREIYHTGRLVEDHAKQIAALEGWEWDTPNARKVWKIPFSERENIVATICDHDAEDRATLERYGIPSLPAFKPIKIGIEAVQSRLKPHPNDGIPMLQYFDDMLVEVDVISLDQSHYPTSTLDEFEGYVWLEPKENKNIKELPVDKFNHGMDVSRYGVCFVDDIGAELIETEETVVYEEEYEISPF